MFHLAGIANDPSADLDPYRSWDVNVLATMRLVDRAARQGVSQFIFPSSGAVYGVRSESRITEDLDLMPISDYNKTKMVAERVILSYGDQLTTTIFRPATVCGYSPRMRFDSRSRKACCKSPRIAQHTQPFSSSKVLSATFFYR